IIMDATGYERDEISPEMDLREDLAIRSSRLPVIMDAVENHFRIKIEVEDFMDVRTIQDIAGRIGDLLDRRKGSVHAAPEPSPIGLVCEQPMESDGTTLETKRLIFRETPLEDGDTQPLELDTMESVVILSAGGGEGVRRAAAGVFRRDYGVNPQLMAFMGPAESRDELGFDLRSPDQVAEAVSCVSELERLAGMVFVLDDVFDKRVSSMDEMNGILNAFFELIRAVLDSPSRKFVLLIHRSSKEYGPSRVLAEGLHGMMLSLSHEFSSVLFRFIRIDQASDLGSAVRGAMDRSRKVAEQVYHEGEAFTVEGIVVPVGFNDAGGIELGRGDVVVLSGGGYGITHRLAKEIAVYGCNIVYMGRTVVENEDELRRMLDDGPNPKGDQPRDATDGNLKAIEIVRNLEELRKMRVGAEYVACDVTDPDAAREALAGVVSRYGRIDGIVHGAGILRDSFAKQMSPGDFEVVTATKFSGAWNLFQGARGHGLKFFVSLSSAAALQGNPGQCNYSAGNRMMSGLMVHLSMEHPDIVFKAMMLPPIEGAGMAENDEVKALMKRMNASYVHVDELKLLFARELALAPADDVWVLFMKSLPDIPSVRIDTSEPVYGAGEMEVGGVVFRNEDFPMIDAVNRIDLRNGELEATRAFSRKKDLWIEDHKPFKFLDHPLVSAIMAVETFAEASRMLSPNLVVTGVQNVRFLDIIECSPDSDRHAVIKCSMKERDINGAVCELSLATADPAASRTGSGKMFPNYKADVIMRGVRPIQAPEPTGFPVLDEELVTRPMDRTEAGKWYQDRTDLQNRYRLIDRMEGTGSTCVKGRMIYRVTEDFAPPRKSVYQYSPYLLEALMQVVNFFLIMRDRNENRSMIPYKIGEVTFLRNCIDGERMVLEARMKSHDDKSITWNARAVDSKGLVVMQAKDLVMQWFAGR
ncbi:MAG: SDR family NAD(P)-dependent oxidoreductase, partial [Pseudomonadota bacterium]